MEKKKEDDGPNDFSISIKKKKERRCYRSILLLKKLNISIIVL
jgi:hypothetical protein